MERCSNCGRPLPTTRRVCPSCHHSRAATVAAEAGGVELAGATRATVREPSLTGWRDALALRASERWQAEARAKQQARRSTNRRWIVLGALVVVALTALFVVNPGHGKAPITASTPIGRLPWSVFRPTDRAFAVDLPGPPVRLPATRWNGLALERYEVDIPGATLAVSMLRPASTQPAARIASQRAIELGARVGVQQDLHVAWGTALEASFNDGATTGWIEVTTSGDTAFVVDARVNGDRARARELFDRLTTSFRPGAG